VLPRQPADEMAQTTNTSSGSSVVDDAHEVSSAPLSPIRYLLRAAEVWGGREAIRFDDRSVSYAETLDRVRHLAGLLRSLGVQPGDRVAVLLPNVPAMLDLHFAVPGTGAVLVPMNTRLSAREYAYILEHSGARCLVADRALQGVVEESLGHLGERLEVVYLDEGPEYEDRLRAVEPLDVCPQADWTLLSINYTSGTTGRPKGVMYVHRGAYLHALGVMTEAGLEPSSGYLWTLPMFHCNGWAFTWAVTAMGARHVCLRQFDPARVWEILHAEGITHLCAAPTVVTMLTEAPEAAKLEAPVRVFMGGAPPSPTLLERARSLGMEITHLYGLTETYGPLAVCAWQPSWDGLRPDEQARLRARQGVATVVTESLRVVDEAMRDVPPDGRTLGEVVMRGNNVMTGYYRDAAATAAAFAGGWFHSGDVGVMHPDGYVELRDRLKDVVISGGENISTIEVEQALAAHPAVMEAAVVGVPDARWGEVPKAFVVRRPGATVTAAELRDFSRDRLARFKVPREIVFREELPKTATGKIQKFVLRSGSADATY
jgi:fatty-acyl-CoA synthase